MLDHIFLTKAIVGFFFLLILTRLMGKKQLAQLTYFDYIVGITIGNFTASMIVDPEVRTLDALLSITIWGTLTVLLSFLSRKHFIFRRLFESSPTVIVENGRVKHEALKKENVTTHNVMLLLRQSGHFKLEDVEFALLETNGNLSVLLKEAASTVRLDALKDVKPKLKTVIVDGYILRKALEKNQKTEEWLHNELRKKGVKNVKEVFIAQIQDDHSLYLEWSNASFYTSEGPS